MSVFVCERHFLMTSDLWRHLLITILKWCAKFSKIRWSITLIGAKNYETAFKFVKVMPRILVASFFRTRCICGYLCGFLKNQRQIRTWRLNFSHFLLTYLWRHSAAPARHSLRGARPPPLCLCGLLLMIWNRKKFYFIAEYAIVQNF